MNTFYFIKVARFLTRDSGPEKWSQERAQPEETEVEGKNSYFAA